jgi:thymidylate kinase
LLLDFLRTLDEENINYVSWKNNHELSKALSGQSDLDILVESISEIRFYSLAKKHGWLELVNPVAKFPSVIHLYKISNRSEIYHLHVYFKVITGESWIKEFVLPLNEFLIEERVICPNNNIWILSNKAQACIFIVRHFLKTGSLMSRFLYWREMDSYKDEWILCKTKIKDLNDADIISLDSYIARSGLVSEFNLPRLLDSVKFRLSLMRFCRFSILLLPSLRLRSFFKRLLNKLVFREKKKFISKGLIVAISGADGAGKSSMISRLSKFHSSFQSCFVYSLGKPQGRIIEMLRRLINSKSRIKKPIKSKFIKNTTIKKAISAVILGFLRLRSARIARKKANDGNLVFVDRWPTTNLGKMDSPKIITGKDSSQTLEFLARIERETYQKIPKADVCFYLKVDVNTAVARNEKRVKVDKETKEEIITRHLDNKAIIPLCKKIVYFDNEGPLDEKFLELQGLVWGEMILIKS